MKIENENIEHILKLMNKSQLTLEGARAVSELNLYEFAVNRLYYSCFYLVSALLLLDGLTVKTHAGAIAKFSELYVKSGLLSRNHSITLNILFQNRQTADYDVEAEVSLEKYEELLAKTEEFVRDVEGLILSELES